MILFRSKFLVTIGFVLQAPLGLSACASAPRTPETSVTTPPPEAAPAQQVATNMGDTRAMPASTAAVPTTDTPNATPPKPRPTNVAGKEDRDKDGLPDETDQCPDEPEDFDGFEDGNGCPDADNDKDGVADVDDQCPNVPETKNGFQDEDGCPDVKK